MDQYTILFDNLKCRPAAPHLQKEHGGNAHAVAAYFCHRTYAMKVEAHFTLRTFNSNEMRVVAKVAKQKAMERQKVGDYD